jgi:hypothetical protein
VTKDDGIFAAHRYPWLDPSLPDPASCFRHRAKFQLVDDVDSAVLAGRRDRDLANGLVHLATRFTRALQKVQPFLAGVRLEVAAPAEASSPLYFDTLRCGATPLSSSRTRDHSAAG